MIKTWFFAAMLLPALMLETGCSRWIGYTPLKIEGNVKNPQQIYSRLESRVHAMGYFVEQRNPEAGYFRVRTQLDGRRNRRRASFFHVMVRPDGTVDVAANGHLIRRHGTVIHHKLCHELTHFIDGLYYEVNQPVPQATAAR